MAAIVTDQFRILSAKNFMSDIESEDNAFYAFIGLPNASEIVSDWNVSPPSPKDNFNEEEKKLKQKQKDLKDQNEEDDYLEEKNEEDLSNIPTEQLFKELKSMNLEFFYQLYFVLTFFFFHFMFMVTIWTYYLMNI